MNASTVKNHVQLESFIIFLCIFCPLHPHSHQWSPCFVSAELTQALYAVKVMEISIETEDAVNPKAGFFPFASFGDLQLWWLVMMSAKWQEFCQYGNLLTTKSVGICQNNGQSGKWHVPSLTACYLPSPWWKEVPMIHGVRWITWHS